MFPSWNINKNNSRTPQGVRGLKLLAPPQKGGCLGRTPQGVRGLKLVDAAQPLVELNVALRKECVD